VRLQLVEVVAAHRLWTGLMAGGGEEVGATADAAEGVMTRHGCSGRSLGVSGRAASACCSAVRSSRSRSSWLSPVAVVASTGDGGSVDATPVSAAPVGAENLVGR
jgi:hypothetical protein